jgi:hypothetical protein
MLVDDQTQRDIKQFHVAEQLRLIGWTNVVCGFDFNKQD